MRCTGCLQRIGKNEKLEECKLKRKILWWGSGGIILALLLSFVFWGLPWGLWKNKQAFEAYLEEKYGEDFVIDDISFDLFHTRKYHAYAYATDYPDVTFYVGQNRYTEELEDGYSFESWRVQAMEDISALVGEFYRDRSFYSVEVLPQNMEISAYPFPSYKEYTTVEVGVTLDELKVTNANSVTEIERAFRFLQALKEKGVPLHHVGISYQNRTLQLQKDDISSINSLEDLGEHLKSYQ